MLTLTMLEVQDISIVSPVRPPVGSIFIFKFPSDKQEEWRADSYNWVNMGANSLPRKDPKLRKDYFAIRIKN